MKEEAEGIRLISAAKEGLHRVVLKANSQTKTFNVLKSSPRGRIFFMAGRRGIAGGYAVKRKG